MQTLSAKVDSNANDNDWTWFTEMIRVSKSTAEHDQTQHNFKQVPTL